MFYIYTCIFVYLLLFFSFYVKLVIWFKIKYISYMYVFIDIQEYDTSDSRKICFLIYIFFLMMFIWFNQILWASYNDCYTSFDQMLWMNVGQILCNNHSTSQACSAERVLAWLARFFVTNIGNFGMGLQAPSLLNTALVFLESRGSSVFVSTKLNLHLLVPLRHYGIYIRSPRECILKP